MWRVNFLTNITVCAKIPIENFCVNFPPFPSLGKADGRLKFRRPRDDWLKDLSRYRVYNVYSLHTDSSLYGGMKRPEVEFLDEIQTKVFLLSIQSHLYSFALRFLFLQTHATSYSFYSVLLYTVKEKGGKIDRKSLPLPYGLKNPYRNRLT